VKRDTVYQEHSLYLHNWYRKRHGAPKLVLSERINQAVDAYAYRLVCRKMLQHTSGLDYVENLYGGAVGNDGKTKKQHVYAACEGWLEMLKSAKRKKLIITIPDSPYFFSKHIVFQELICFYNQLFNIIDDETDFQMCVSCLIYVWSFVKWANYLRRLIDVTITM